MLADEKQRLVREFTSSPLPRDISLSTDRRYALSSAKQIGNARTVAINMTNGSTPVMMTVEDIA